MQNNNAQQHVVVGGVVATIGSSATTISPHHSQHYTLGDQLPSIIHQRSVKSCDFEAAAIQQSSETGVAFAGISGVNFENSFNNTSHNISSFNNVGITTAGDLATNDTSFYNNNE